MAAALAARIAERAAAEGLTLSDGLTAMLVRYLELLQHWNRKINLTSLSEPDEAIDRLLLEPVAAARYLPIEARLADLGSGGGSPAIPLALALRAPDVLMVESRTRKAAFLREAVRELGLPGNVEAVRFEDVASMDRYRAAFDIVSIRAVRHDDAALSSASALLRPGAIVALFRGPAGPPMPEFSATDLAWRDTLPLLRSSGSRLTRLFHVEHS